MPMPESKIIVRPGAPQGRLTQGGKTYHYIEEDGEMRISAVTGTKALDKEKLLSRLHAARVDNCSLCLRADMWQKITGIMLMEFME